MAAAAAASAVEPAVLECRGAAGGRGLCGLADVPGWLPPAAAVREAVAAAGSTSAVLLYR